MLMKKTILTLFLVGSLFANAQVKYGVKAGYVNSQLIDRYKDDPGSEFYGSKHSLYGGFLLEYRFQPAVAFQAELLYVGLGYNENADVSYSSLDGSQASYKRIDKLNVGQISLPLSIKYYANNAFNVSAGMNLGYNISGKNIYGKEDATKDYDIFDEEDWGSKTARFYAGPFVGMEYNTPKGIFFDARYNIGLTGLKFGNSEKYTEKINYFQIGVGYKFK